MWGQHRVRHKEFVLFRHKEISREKLETNLMPRKRNRHLEASLTYEHFSSQCRIEKDSDED